MVTDPRCAGKNLHLRVMGSGVSDMSSLPLSGPVILSTVRALVLNKGMSPRFSLLHLKIMDF